MVEADLSPRDPARWWLAVAVEREQAQRDESGREGNTNIKVVQ